MYCSGKSCQIIDHEITSRPTNEPYCFVALNKSGAVAAIFNYVKGRGRNHAESI
jgi:hypothetical protein